MLSGQLKKDNNLNPTEFPEFDASWPEDNTLMSPVNEVDSSMSEFISKI